MNKYTAIGLLAAADEGKRVIVMSSHHRAVRDAVNEVHALVPDLQWNLANSNERVTLPSGGCIRFLSDDPGRLRGLAADIVLLEDDRDLRHELLAALHIVIHSSKHGEIIRY